MRARADRTRTRTVAGATDGAGILSTLGPLATQRILLELVAAHKVARS